MHIEAKHRTTVDDRRIVKAGKGSNRTDPLLNGVVQQRLAAQLSKFARHVLRRRSRLENDTHLVREVCRIGLKAAHHRVDPILMKNETVGSLVRFVAQHTSYAVLYVALDRGKPVIQLPDNIWVSYPTYNDALISDKLGSFKLLPSRPMR